LALVDLSTGIILGGLLKTENLLTPVLCGDKGYVLPFLLTLPVP